VVVTKHRTDRQEELLEYIAGYTYDKGYPPSMREMMHAVGLSTTSAVHYHLQNAVGEGTLTYVPGHGRTYRVTTSDAREP